MKAINWRCIFCAELLRLIPDTYKAGQSDYLEYFFEHTRDRIYDDCNRIDFYDHWKVVQYVYEG